MGVKFPDPNSLLAAPKVRQAAIDGRVNRIGAALQAVIDTCPGLKSFRIPQIDFLAAVTLRDNQNFEDLKQAIITKIETKGWKMQKINGLWEFTPIFNTDPRI